MGLNRPKCMRTTTTMMTTKWKRNITLDAFRVARSVRHFIRHGNRNKLTQPGPWIVFAFSIQMKFCNSRACFRFRFFSSLLSVRISLCVCLHKSSSIVKWDEVSSIIIVRKKNGYGQMGKNYYIFSFFKEFCAGGTAFLFAKVQSNQTKAIKSRNICCLSFPKHFYYSILRLCYCWTLAIYESQTIEIIQNH